MGELAHTMVVCGLLSGTQPLTLMGLMVVMGGAHGRRNAWCYVAGAFSVQAVVVLVSGFLLGATVDESSRPGSTLVGLRIAADTAILDAMALHPAAVFGMRDNDGRMTMLLESLAERDVWLDITTRTDGEAVDAHR